MTRDEAAAALNGNQYREEGSKELFASMKKAGLVALFGASDDLMEFQGAIDDEVGAYNGTTVHLTSDGLLKSDCEEGDECPYFKKMQKSASTIKAIWGQEGFSFTYATALPHSTFIINDDDRTYCRGIVFNLADAA